MQVYSTPTNAAVKLDDVVAGTTPLFLTGISAGTHKVEVDREGYHSYETQVQVQAGSTTTVIATLIPETQTVTPTVTTTTSPTTVTPTPTTTGTLTGSMQVYSTPTNAVVKLDDVVAGTTPLFLTGISAETHKVEVDKEGYHSQGGGG